MTADEAAARASLIRAQKMEAIGRLVAGVAHEVNNPLASILAFSQLIRTDPALPPALRTGADLLVQEANRTRVIVESLLEFARERPPERVATDLRPLVEGILALQSYLLSRNQVTVELDIPSDLPAVLVDRGQLQHVLVNLTFHSADAIQRGGRPGTITIEARPLGEADAERVRLTITDDGPGIPETLPDGAGVGLSVSSAIVAALGGTLVHERAPGGGGMFVMDLPSGREVASSGAATGRPLGEAPAPPEQPPQPATRPRVLVLDDEPPVREFLARALARYGYEPVIARSGAEALEIVRSDPPAAILCDHRMAGMTGTEFHAAVSEIAPAVAGRLALMSGDVLEPELQAFARAHRVQLLAKPFDLSAVAAMVSSLLEVRPDSPDPV